MSFFEIDKIIYTYMTNWFPMFIFAHIGLTLIAFYVFAKIFKFKESISYHYVAFGAILPDLVDKGLGILLFPELIGNGRIFAHTLVFAVLVILIGDYFVRKNGNFFVAIIGWGSMCHLLLDRMWTIPQTLYWPLLGSEFPVNNNVVQTDFSVYLLQVVDNVFISGISQVLTFEIIGFVITTGFFTWNLVSRKQN